MKWKDVHHLSDKHFRRMTGVNYIVFHQMADALEKANGIERKHPSRGKPSSLSIEDKILLLLMYYREYRTMFHIGLTYGISESTVCKIIRDTENKLIKDERFHLPGKKELLRVENNFEVVLIDVTESPIERPKKNSANTIVAKRNVTP